VAKTFYNEFIPEIRNIAAKARKAGKVEQADKIIATLNEILAQDNHKWYIEKASADKDASPETKVKPESDETVTTDTGMVDMLQQENK